MTFSKHASQALATLVVLAAGVFCAPAQTCLDPLALAGAAAPGGGAFDRFETARINTRGDLVARVRLVNGTTGVWKQSSAGVWTEIARAGDVTSPIWIWSLEPDSHFVEFGTPVIDAAGNVAYSALVNIPGRGVRNTVWLTADYENHWLVTTDVTPSHIRYVAGSQTFSDETGTTTYYDEIGEPSFAGDGSVYLAGDVRLSSWEGRQGIWRFKRPTGLYYEPRGGTRPDMVFMAGSATPSGQPAGTTLRQLLRPVTAATVPATPIFLSGTAEPATGDPTSDGLWRTNSPEQPVVFSEIAVCGQVAPASGGDVWHELGQLATAGVDASVFWASLADPVTQLVTAEGLWSAESTGPELIAKSGDTAPGTTGGTFASFGDPSVGRMSNAAFLGFVEGSGDPEDHGIWTVDAGGTVTLRVRRNDPAPGTTGGVFDCVGDPSVNAQGLTVFGATLRREGGATPASDRGVWIIDNDGTVSLLFRNGDPVTVALGDTRLIADHELFAFNDGGQVLASLKFTDGTEGLFTASLPDSQPPSIPQNTAAQWLSSSDVAITWSASTDNRGVREYSVHRDGVLVATVTGTEYTDAAVQPGSSHAYTIEAVDFKGNVSAPSPSVTGSTPDQGMEFIIDNRGAGYDGKGYWDQTTDVDSYGTASDVIALNGVAKWTPTLPSDGFYEVFVRVSAENPDGSFEGRDRRANYALQHANGLETIELDQNTLVGDWVKLGAWEFDAGESGFLSLVNDVNQSDQTIADATRFVLLLDDVNPPTDPASLVAEWASSSHVALSWTGSTDDNSFVQYEIYRDGTLAGTTENTTWHDSGLTPGGSYLYTVRAVDFQSNASGIIPAQSVTLPTTSSEIVIDNDDPGYTGSQYWVDTTTVDAFGYGAKRITTGQRARWEPDFPVAGHYEVWAWITAENADGSFETRDTHADYTVNHSNGTELPVFDQNTAVGTWAWLGTWEFDAGTGDGLWLDRPSNQFNQTIADAVKFTLLVSDEQAPTIPQNVTADWISSTRVRVAWDASTDDLGVQQYRIRRNGIEIGTTSTTEFIDTMATPSDAYTYTVEAVDFGGVFSGQSSSSASVIPPLTGIEIIIDNGDPGYTGSQYWADTETVDAYGAGAKRIALGQTARWEPAFPITAHYEVWVWVTAENANGSFETRDAHADYTINHTGGTEALIFDQNTSVGTWAWLGTWEFQAGTGDGAILDRPSNQYNQTIADAVKFTLLLTDAQPPTVPQNVGAEWKSSSHIHIDWDASSDDLGVMSYTVRRDGTNIATVDTPGYADLGLLPGSFHSYTVEANDYAGATSGESPSASTTTPVLSGTETIIDNGDPGYDGKSYWNNTNDLDAYQGDSKLMATGHTATWAPTLSVPGMYEVHVWVSALRPDTSTAVRDPEADYTVASEGAIDSFLFDQGTATGEWTWLGTYFFNPSQPDDGTVTVTKSHSRSEHTIADAVRWRLLLTDSEAPTTPSAVVANWRSSAIASIDWDPSEDNYGVSEYRVYRDGALAGTTSFTTFDDTGLAPGTTHAYTVSAVDSEANESSPSPTATVTLPALAGVEVVVDNLDSGFAGQGYWSQTGDVDTYGPDSVIVGIGESATWTPHLPATGWYEVYHWVSADTGGSLQVRDPAADYTITHSSGSETIILDQNENPGAWVLIGSYHFNSGLAGSVSVLRDSGSSLRTIADAIRWVQISPVTPGDMNGDGAVNGFDVDFFVLALSDPAVYTAVTGLDPDKSGDTNGDGRTNGFDIESFVGMLTMSDGLSQEVEVLRLVDLSEGPVDFDGDSVFDAPERIAGTDSRDASDFLRIIDIRLGSREIELEWTSVMGRRYDLQASATGEDGSWRALNRHPIEAAGERARFTAEKPSDPAHFFRAVLLP